MLKCQSNLSFGFFTSLYYDCLEIKKIPVSFEKKNHLISEELNSKVDLSFFYTHQIACVADSYKKNSDSCQNHDHQIFLSIPIVTRIS